jgi:dipeptidyl aminopeptidase/acylaminoacyl peptidase
VSLCLCGRISTRARSRASIRRRNDLGQTKHAGGTTEYQVERFKAKSADGTLIDAYLTRPPNAPTGRLPAILRIHGGPVAQYSTGFNLEWQMLAARGFAVVAANPRGSSGYGRDFSHALWADWGNKDYDDVMAAVDAAIAMGVADPDRLGVGGWSYGGILTDHVIARTTRFKAAISGASEFNYLANYGNDHYQRQWEAELGLPWQNTQLWIKLSPFYRLDKIVTPTLVMGGDADMNVPIIGGQQLYQGLKRLGRDTELVVYPGETHAIRRPSFQQDRFERYLAWYTKYLKPVAKASSQ